MKTRATRPGRARGIGTGWFVSIGLHAALLLVVGRTVMHVAEETADEPQVVMTLDLRSTSFAPRAEQRISEPRAASRAEIPAAPRTDLLEPESETRDLEASFVDDSGESAPTSVVAVAGGSSAASVGARVGFTRLPQAAQPSPTSGDTKLSGRPDGTPNAGGPAVLLPPELAESPTIEYPSRSRRSHEEGDVRCRIHVSALGLVELVEVLRSSGFEALDEAARTGLTHWRFKPATCGGTPCACVVDHVVTFRLKTAAAVR